MTVIVSIVNWWLDRVDSRLELLKVNCVTGAYQLALIGLLAIFQVASADVLVLKSQVSQSVCVTLQMSRTQKHCRQGATTACREGFRSEGAQFCHNREAERKTGM